MKKVSIIVPIYNLSQYIDKCYKSINNQTYNNWELILINDGSTDNSLDICNEIAENDNRVIVVSSKNKGVSHARNIGIDKATGDYIIFIDGDDYIEDNTLESLVDNIEKNNSDVAVAGYYFKDNDMIPSSLLEFNTIKSEELLHKHLNFGFISSVCLNMYKIDVFKDIRYAEQIKNFEDWEFMFQVIQNSHKVSYCDGCFYHYITRNYSASKSKVGEKTLTAFLITEEVKKKIIDFEEYKNEIESLEASILLKIMAIYAEYGVESKRIKNILKRIARNNFKIIFKSKTFNIRKRIYLLLIIINPSLFKILYRIKNRRNLK